MLKLAQIPVTLTRLALGYFFLRSGVAKILPFDIALFNIQDPAAVLEAMSGLLLIVGFFTRLSSFILIAVLLWMNPMRLWDDFTSNGFASFTQSRDFLHLLLLSWLAAFGAGNLSMDYFAQKRFLEFKSRRSFAREE